MKIDELVDKRGLGLKNGTLDDVNWDAVHAFMVELFGEGALGFTADEYRSIIGHWSKNRDIEEWRGGVGVGGVNIKPTDPPTAFWVSIQIPLVCIDAETRHEEPTPKQAKANRPGGSDDSGRRPLKGSGKTEGGVREG